MEGHRFLDNVDAWLDPALPISLSSPIWKTANILVFQTHMCTRTLMQSEAPAPTPVAAPPAAAEASKATTATSAAIEKRKSRQSFSVPKGAAEDLAQQVEPQPPAARASTGSVTGSVTGASVSGASATTSVAGSYQGLSQVGSPPSALRELPALRDAPPNKREELFKLKLQLCGVIFSFDDPTSDKRGKVCSAQTFRFAF